MVKCRQNRKQNIHFNKIINKKNEIKESEKKREYCGGKKCMPKKKRKTFNNFFFLCSFVCQALSHFYSKKIEHV